MACVQQILLKACSTKRVFFICIFSTKIVSIPIAIEGKNFSLNVVKMTDNQGFLCNLVCPNPAPFCCNIIFSGVKINASLNKQT